MMFNGQTIDSGNNSTNIQGTKVQVNNYGVSYSEVKELVMDIFKSNFYDLGEKVEKIIQERAEKILDDYLEKLSSKNPEYIKSTQDPDIRYAIYETQKNYARRGDQIDENILIEVLVNRTTVKGNCLQEIVLNEALETIPKITPKQIDILTLIFLNAHINYLVEFPIDHFISLNNIIRSGIEIKNNEYGTFQHLEYASCLNISIGSIEYDRIIENKFPQIKDIEEAERVISGNSELSLMKNLWDNSQMCHSTLTSVGIAIAVANIKIKTGVDYDLGIWIKE